jgi:predicted CoA-binding protein
MSQMDTLVQDFLAQKKIAVVGVSDKRETGSNLGYRKFKAAGYAVSAVNPRLTTFEGDPCYPDLKSIPEKPDAVFILASPKVTEQVVQQCVDLGIQRVWMHCLMGTKPGLAASSTSVSPEDHGDPRRVSESISEPGFRSRDDAGDVSHPWLS